MYIYGCVYLLEEAFMVTHPPVCGAGAIAFAKIYGKDINNVMGKEYA